MSQLYRNTDPDTSREAALTVITALPALEERVLGLLLEQPYGQGLTSYELAQQLGLSIVTVSPRLRPLANRCLIRASGRRIGPSGRSQIVWVAVTRQQRLVP